MSGRPVVVEMKPLTPREHRERLDTEMRKRADALDLSRVEERLSEIAVQVIEIGKEIEILIEDREDGYAEPGDVSRRETLIQKRFHLYREDMFLRRRRVELRTQRVQEAQASAKAERDARAKANFEREQQAARERAATKDQRRREIEAENVAREARKVAAHARRLEMVQAQTQKPRPRDEQNRVIWEEMLRAERALWSTGVRNVITEKHLYRTCSSVPMEFRREWNEKQVLLGFSATLSEAEAAALLKNLRSEHEGK